MTRLSDWVEDRESVHSKFGGADVFYRALEHGVTDRKVIANAIALTEAAAKLSHKYPSVPFDDIAVLIVSAQKRHIFLTYRLLVLRWHGWLLIHHRAREWKWHIARPLRWAKSLWNTPAESTYREGDE
jgi:hypothetical protein